MVGIPEPLPTRRAALLAQLEAQRGFDIAVVGGGATGLSVALDAALRGHRVLLVEAGDFAQGTSSRSTKLIHGGVRYLAQGQLPLVWEALHERAVLLRNAPHLARPLPFVMPCYRLWEKPFYGTGLKLYDALAGRRAEAVGLKNTEFLGRDDTLVRLPGVRRDGLRGGVQYWDGQFDDARLALAIARSAAAQGALLVNHMAATGLRHDVHGRIAGLTCRDAETGRTVDVSARCVVNATGVWVDTLRRRDDAGPQQEAAPLVAPSQGAHVVVDADFLPGQHALLVPRTADGRVLFAIPWQGKVVLGTTDRPRDDAPEEPEAAPDEVDFILQEAGRCLQRQPTRADVRSRWAGLRPLVRTVGGHEPSRKVSREHTVLVAPSGLVSVTGGKWTTCRAMAEDVLAQCEDAGLLARRPAGETVRHRLVGAPESAEASAGPYGTETPYLESLPGATRELGGGLTEAMVRFAARHEYAREVADVLARRSRLLFLDAALARRLAVPVAALLAEELGRPVSPAPFEALAARYIGAAGGV